MKHLFIFLLSIGLLQAQSAKKIAKHTQYGETFVKTANLTGVVFCGNQPSKLYIGSKRIIFTSPGISLDLKIYKREKEQWHARDNDGIEYLVIPVTHAERPDEPAILFLPSPDSGHLGIMISHFEICK